MAIKKRRRSGEFNLKKRREGIFTYWGWWVWVKT